VIDLDRMEAQLSAALTAPVGPPPVRARSAPAAAPRTRGRSGPQPASASAPASVRELVERGAIDAVAARAAGAAHRRDQVTWVTMLALLEGRRDAVHRGITELEALAEAGDAEAAARAWVQRFWAGFEWGTDDERLDVLDHCRTRAYRYDDLVWWGNLSLLLAAMGKPDEAVRAFDATLALIADAPRDAVRFDVVTNMVEAAAFLGDAGRIAVAGRELRTPTGRFVVVGDGVVCKGSVDRYLALLHGATGDSATAGGYFRSAEAAHRAAGAEPLLARTRRQASTLVAAA